MPQQIASQTPAPTAGCNLSVPAYYEGQNCGIPDHYVTRERAIEAKMSGQAKPCHRGKAIMWMRPKPEGRYDTHRESIKTGWRVVGQTMKPFIDMHSMGTPVRNSDPENPVYRKPAPGPGCPRYSLV
jgi:hypothetical protein